MEGNNKVFLSHLIQHLRKQGAEDRSHSGAALRLGAAVTRYTNNIHTGEFLASRISLAQVLYWTLINCLILDGDVGTTASRALELLP